MIAPAAVVVSPLRRAAQTAAVAVPAVAAVVDPRWTELDFGLLSGLTWGEVEARHPEVAAAWRRDGAPTPPRGESTERLLARVAEAVLALAAAHPDADVVVVTHGGPIRATVGLARGLRVDELWRVRVRLGGVRAVRLSPGVLARLGGAAASIAVR